MVDPALCPIPPGFELIDSLGFNDDFENFRNGSGYANFKPGDGEYNFGVSKRWKNSRIRSPGIVCGFQFKIGPNFGSRIRFIPQPSQGNIPVPPKIEFLGEVDSGDVNIHFPRRDGPGGDRGGYIVSLKWFRDNPNEDGRIAEASLKKEIPHGTYGADNYYKSLEFLPGRPNPTSIEKTQIRDGQWHSFLGVIYNDWHRGRNFQTSAEYPIIGLWYSHEATSNFADFSLLGMAADIGNMEPRGPLKEGIGRDQHPYIDIDDWIDLLAPPLNWKEQIEALDFIPGVGYLLTLFGGNLVGDDLALAEHALQIRIDDVPLDEIEIRNVYAANVNYIGIHPSEYFAICTAEARAVLDAQAAIVKLQERLKEARLNYVKPGRGFGDESNPWRQIMDSIINIELPNARSDLRAAEFIYGRCKERNMVSIPADDLVTGGVFTPRPNNGKIPSGNITGGSFT